MQNRNEKRLLVKGGLCLVTHPDIALTLGKSEAIFLQQLHYWLTTDNTIGTVVEGQRWIYNSYKAWAKNLQIYSESTIRRAVRKLETLGIIHTKNLNKKQSDHTKWYTINYTALKDLIPHVSEPQQKREGRGNLDGQGVKMNSPSVQNESIIHKENKENIKDSFLSYSPSLDQNTQDKNFQTSGERDVSQHMIVIWNQVVEEGKRTLGLNTKRIRFLKQAFQTQFQSCLNTWKAFCQRIASSQFLMGEIKPFKASLDWVLKFDILQRILEGDFGIGDRFVSEKTDQKDLQALEEAIQTSSEHSTVKHFRAALLNRLGDKTYSSWFQNTLMTLEHQRLSIKTPSSFYKGYLTKNFLETIEILLTNILPNYSLDIH